MNGFMSICVFKYLPKPWNVLKKCGFAISASSFSYSFLMTATQFNCLLLASYRYKINRDPHNDSSVFISVAGCFKISLFMIILIQLFLLYDP